jgi:hypothetical protein
MKYVMVAAGTFFLVFVTARAVRVPFTYDEAASYVRYIDTTVPSVFDTNLLSIFNFEVATNHFLNTALTKCSYLIGGANESVLRLANLLGYALYLGCAGLILRRLSNPLIALGAFLLLNLNPYLLDFFALSRGYGLSLGLLMGSLFFVLRFFQTPSAGRGDLVDLSRGLALAGAAVMANFALLNVYLGMLIVAVIAIALSNRRAENLPVQHADPDGARRARTSPWLAVTAVFFIPLVLSQDSALSDALYQPVVVRLGGLDDAAVNRARVVRLGIHGRESPLLRNPASQEWSRNDRSSLRGIRIELPLAEAEELTRIEAVIGTRAFSFDPRLTSAWTARDDGSLRVFESAATLSLRRSRVPTFGAVINWSGDHVYVVRLAIASAFVWGILGAFAVLLRLLQRGVVRTRIMDHREWRTLSSSALWVGVLAGTPLYLLKRNSELYFGGTRGLVQDTFTSIIENSFYGAHYSDAQVAAVFGCVGGLFAIFSAVLVIAYRHRRLSSLRPASSLVAILALVSMSLVAQRLLFGTVYLVGRTALFYIPLFVLFFAFLSDALAQASRFGKAFAIVTVITAVGLATFHFANTANLKYVYDWKHDASTESMIDDVRQFASSGPVTVGVAPAFSPVAVYYARRAAAPIEVVVLPTTRPVDFLYLEDRDVHSGDIVSRYPFTQTALVRVSR